MMAFPLHRRAASIFSVQAPPDDTETSPSPLVALPDADSPLPSPTFRQPTALSLSFDDDDDGTLKDDDGSESVNVHTKAVTTHELEARVNQRVESASPAAMIGELPLVTVLSPAKVNVSDLASAMSWGACKNQ